MEPVRTLTLAGLKRNARTFAGLAVLLVLAAFALTFTISLHADLSGRALASYEEAGGGDVHALDWVEEAEGEAARRLQAQPEVGQVRVLRAFSAPMAFEDAEGEPLGESENATAFFEPWGGGLKVKALSDGFDSYEADAPGPKADEVYVTPAENVLSQLEVGDAVVVSLGQEERRFTVAGFFEDPQLGSPFMGTRRFLLDPQTFDELLPLVEEEMARAGGANPFAVEKSTYPFMEYEVDLSDEARAAGLDGRDLARILEEEGVWSREASVFSEETMLGQSLIVVQVISALLAVFALLLFVIALTLCVHSASVAIEEGYADQGIAKAVGVTPGMLSCALILQYALTALGALAVGFAVGLFVEPVAWPPFLMVTGVLVQASVFPAAALAILGLLFAVLVCAVALKARKIGRITPLAALRQGAGDVRFSPRGSCKISGSRLSASLAWRAVASRKRSYVGLGVCALLLCAFIALCFGIGAAVSEDEAVNRAFGIWESDVSVELVSDEVGPEEVRGAIEEVAPISHEWLEGAYMLNLDGAARTFLGLSDPSVLDESSLIEGRMPRQSNEVTVGLNLARSQDLSVGDELVIADPSGQEKTLIACGVVSSVLNGGDGAFLTFEGLQRLTGDDLEDTSRTRQYQLEDAEKADAVRAHLEERFGDEVDTRFTGLFGSAAGMILLVRNMLTAIGYAMCAFAVLIAVAAVALVSQRMLSAERADLGALRACGFKVRALRVSFAWRFFGVALAGGAVGAAAAFLGGSSLVGSLFSLFGAGAFTIALPVWSAAAVTVALALVFAASAYVFSRSIRTVSIQALVTE